MTTNVYLCHVPGDRVRRLMANLVLTRWQQLEDAGEPISVRVIRPSTLGCSAAEFQRERRIFAEADAGEDHFVLADDDCLPVTPDFIKLGLATLSSHFGFAILSLHPHTIREWNPPHYITDVDDEVQEHVSVGGIRFCRHTGVELTPNSGPGYDRTQCELLRAASWRVGYFRKLFMNHVGEGFSTVWNQ